MPAGGRRYRVPSPPLKRRLRAGRRPAVLDREVRRLRVVHDQRGRRLLRLELVLLVEPEPDALGMEEPEDLLLIGELGALLRA